LDELNAGGPEDRSAETRTLSAPIGRLYGGGESRPAILRFSKGPELVYVGAVFGEEFPQYGAMTVMLILAVAPHRETGLSGESRQQVEKPGIVGSRHLLAVAAHERLPLLRGSRRLCLLHEFGTGSELRQPHVVPVIGRETLLRHTARRPSNRAYAKTLSALTLRTQSDDSDAHIREPSRSVPDSSTSRTERLESRAHREFTPCGPDILGRRRPASSS
jgi:hypothetical protein